MDPQNGCRGSCSGTAAPRSHADEGFGGASWKAAPPRPGHPSGAGPGPPGGAGGGERGPPGAAAAGAGLCPPFARRRGAESGGGGGRFPAGQPPPRYLRTPRLSLAGSPLGRGFIRLSFKSISAVTLGNDMCVSAKWLSRAARRPLSPRRTPPAVPRWPPLVSSTEAL